MRIMDIQSIFYNNDVRATSSVRCNFRRPENNLIRQHGASAAAADISRVTG